jgi:alpha-beta hydrolase superfamily lysophospholipase
MSVQPFPAAPEAAFEEGFLHSGDHTRLYWQRYRPVVPRATVAVFHGGGDHSGRYPSLVGALVRGGFTVALVDFRGHGQSDGRRWAIDGFSDYLDDAEAFLQAERRAGTGRLFLLGHGGGALIAARWALDHVGAVSGFVFAAPTFGFGPAAPPLGRRRARLLGGLLPRHGLTARVAPADLTTDPELQEWIGRDPLRGTATTARWFTASLAAQREVLSAAPGFETPLLMLAGGDDQIAEGRASHAFFERAGAEDKKLVVYPGFRHDLFNERGRERPLADVVTWLEPRAGEVTGDRR